MSGARITVDGLWRCLCPSIDAATFTRAISTPYRPRRQQLPNNSSSSSSTRPKCAAAPTRRLLHTTPRRLEEDVSGAPREEGTNESAPLRRIIAEGAGRNSDASSPPGFHENLPPQEEPDDSFAPLLDIDRDMNDLASSDRQAFQDLARLWTEPPPPPPYKPAQPDAPSSSTPPDESSAAARDGKWKFASAKTPVVNMNNVQRILKKQFPFEVPPGVTNEDVFEAIRYTRNLQDRRWRIITKELVKHLLANGVPPNTFIYETLLMAHASTEGSADAVRSLLGEMRQKKIAWSSTAYHSALRALAIHPDYLIRADVLRQMKERWIEVNLRGQQHVALGLLRDEQYELALEKLEDMTLRNERVEPWVFDIFIYVFGRLEFLDDALRIARHRLDTGHEIPANVWYFLLDVCSKGHNHDATAYIWARTVTQGIVNPSDGVCLNVLNMAAAHGDADFATEVIQLLAARGTKLGAVHYEAVADAYCAQGNIDKAVEALCIMHAAGVDVSNASVGSLAQALRRDPSQIDTAILAMTRLREKDHHQQQQQQQPQISIVLFNAVLDALARSDVPSPRDAYARALALYRRVREFVPGGPDRETFRRLLWRCTDPDLAQFLAGEMVHFGVRQNLVIKELLFAVQVRHGGPAHRAKRYFYKIAPHHHHHREEGKRDADADEPRKWKWFMALAVQLVRRLIAERDPEAWRILAYCRSNGLSDEAVAALREEVETGKIVMREEEEEEEEEGGQEQEETRVGGDGDSGDEGEGAARWEPGEEEQGKPKPKPKPKTRDKEEEEEDVRGEGEREGEEARPGNGNTEKKRRTTEEDVSHHEEGSDGEGRSWREEGAEGESR